MTNYGTIPTSSSSSSPPVNTEFISRAKERIIAGLATRRPWRQMFDYHMFSLPRPLREAAARVKTNLWYFTMNYALVVLLILFVSLLWHPISLLVFLALMLIWSFLYFLRDEPLVVVGRTIGDRTVLAVLAVFSVFLLLLTHATTEILVSLLVGLVLVAVHAAVRRTDDLFVDGEEGGGA